MYTGTSPAYGTSPPPNALSAPPTPVAALNGRLLAFLAPQPAPSPDVDPPTTDGALERWGRTIGRFFSRSAPAGNSLTGVLGASPVGNVLEVSSGILTGGGGGGGGAGSWVRVVDLLPLTRETGRGAGGKARGRAVPRDVHAFEAGRAAVGGLAFTPDGTRLVVVRRDGLGAGVWGVRPASAAVLPGVLQTHVPRPRSEADLASPAHLYKLRRGRTGAVVEAVAGARDGRFVALATRRRTVHVFAVNPYGGRADVRSHLGARVRDAEAVGAHSGVGMSVLDGITGGPPTEVHALVRMHLRAPPHPAAQQPTGAGDVEAPPPLLAPLAVVFVPASAGNPLRSRSPASPAAPVHAPAGGVQDVLVFDPADGVLSLRRVALAIEAPGAHAMGVPLSVSMSLPTSRLMGTSMSASPPAYGSYARGQQAAAGGGGAQSAATEAIGELGGKEAVVATWNLRRRRGWAEIRRAEVGVGEGVAYGRQRVKEDWLAQAELSTFSTAPRILPRPIYLSHQFSFYTLGEDYHALIRRYKLRLRGTKIDVRREVEVSGALTGGGEAFVEGIGASSSPRAIRRHSRASQASFDEPLASALAGAQYPLPPPVLPMLPNGTPSSFRSAIPVRAVAAGLGDGVAEGLGRLRREMRHQRQRQRARSPARKGGGGGDDMEASVPLEFDEEDEDFVGIQPSQAESYMRVHGDREDDDALSTATMSRNGEDSVTSLSTPSTSADPLEDEVEAERLDVELEDGGGWAQEDKLAVEEAERFDNISVVGFLDEEQAAAAMQVEAARRKGSTGTARGRKRRN
ncbi:hypothetical protein GGX14DRAFT_513857 [Mycena pura]|uniref:BCAS3 WD40 domain-containing protein n=1 Tax=Mycena pura TaxID=153505 RepID=A0AAD6YMG5_9AGAR|nr:hypothetical protein GGX14DRAFT_513857 [Mycena pura]